MDESGNLLYDGQAITAEETDPVFTAWLATNPLDGFLTSETDPAFTAWLDTDPLSGYLTAETDPVFSAWLATNPLAGYLTAETDPVFTAHVAYGITATNISNWGTAYGWGNHATQGYLKSVTAHNLLSTTHGDTLAGSVVAGDLVYGNSTPKWARLAKGTNGQVLTMVNNLPAWATASSGGGSPGGSDGSIQYNNNGMFGGNTVFVYDKIAHNIKFGSTLDVNNSEYSFVAGISNYVDTSVYDFITGTGHFCYENSYNAVFGSTHTVMYSSECLIAGYANLVESAFDCVVLGTTNTVYNTYWAVLIGAGNAANAPSTVGVGNFNTLNGESSTAVGYSNTTNGFGAGCFGFGCVSNEYFDQAYGLAVEASGAGAGGNAIDNSSMAVGGYFTNNTAGSFGLGWGSKQMAFQQNKIFLYNLPSTNPGVTGQLWRDSNGFLKVS